MTDREQKKSRIVPRLFRWQLQSNALVILTVLVLVFTSINKSFLSPFNLYNFLMQNEYRMVMITGLAVIILGGEVDFSIGSQISLVAVLIGRLITLGMPVGMALLCGIVGGVSCGALNGFLISTAKLPAFIVTLATQRLFQGISYMVSGGMTYSDFPASIINLSGMRTDGWPASHTIVILCVLFLWSFFTYTVAGKTILSMGYDEDVVLQSDIHVSRYTFVIYIIGSLFYVLSAILMISRQGLAVSNMGEGMEIDGLFAACIAGAGAIILKNNQAKHRVHVLDFYLGMLVIGVIENGMQLSGSIQYMQDVLKSVIVILSLLLSINHHNM
jgi:ribose transport system permease protein